MNIEQEIWDDFEDLSKSSLSGRLSYGAANAHFGSSYEDKGNLAHNGLNKRLEYDEDFAIDKFLSGIDINSNNIDWGQLEKLYPKFTKVEGKIIDEKVKEIIRKARRTEKERLFIEELLVTEWAEQREILFSKIPNEVSARDYLIDLRWGNQIICPRCEHNRIYMVKEKDSFRFKCQKCSLKFTEKIGTIFTQSNLPLLKWYEGIYLLTSNKTKRISTPQLASVLNTTQKTAWAVATKIQSKVNSEFISKIKNELLENK